MKTNPLVPVDLWGVVVAGPDGEWLDYGTLRADPDASRLAFNEFLDALRAFTITPKQHKWRILAQSPGKIVLYCNRFRMTLDGEQWATFDKSTVEDGAPF